VLDHLWTVRSRHRTADGEVVYESCHCGARRVRLSGRVVAQL
jgi:hypothetical protein